MAVEFWRAEPGAATAGMSSSHQRLAGILVLIVDDQPEVLLIVSQLLTASGAQVISCSSASEALLRLQEQSPDVVISDLTMPEMDGLEFIRSVRANPQTSGLPAAALTSLCRPESFATAHRAGYTAYLVKPVAYEELTATVERLAGRDESQADDNAQI